MRKIISIIIVIGLIAISGSIFYILGCAGATGGGDGDGNEFFIIDGTWQPAGIPDPVGTYSGGTEPRVFFYAAKMANVVWGSAPEGYTVESNSFSGSGWVGVNKSKPVPIWPVRPGHVSFPMVSAFPSPFGEAEAPTRPSGRPR